MRIDRKMLAFASAVTLSVGLGAAVLAPAAHAAGPPPHDATNDSVTCNDLLGKIKFSVPLTLGGNTPNQITLTLKSDDCTDNTVGPYDPDTNPGGVSLKGVSSKGILNSTTNDCLGLQGLSTSTSGDVPMKWTTVAKGADPDGPGPLPAPVFPKLTNTASTIHITQTWGGTYNDGGSTSPAAASDSWGGQYGFFAFGTAASGLPHGSSQSFTSAPSVTGSFTGGNGGATSFFQGETTQTTGAIANECFSATGIKGITFGIGGFTLK